MFGGLEITWVIAFFGGIISTALGKKVLLVMFPQLAPFLAISGPVQDQVVKLLDKIDPETCSNDKIIEVAKDLGLTHLEQILSSKTGLKIDLNQDGTVGG